MSVKEAKATRKRLRNSYLTSIISISLVLFLLGILGLLILNVKALSDYVKENIGFTIFLKDNIKEVDIIRLQKRLDATKYVKESQFISKEKAAKILQEELGEDFIEFLGYNPLSASIEIRLHAQYANSDSLLVIENKIQNYQEIDEIYYQKSLVHLVNENIKKISFIILIFSGLLLLIALTLINNTIRLSVYSKRFLINTMHIVGATRRFIRKPFLIKSTVHGIYASIIAILLIIGLLYVAQKEMPEIITFENIEILGILFTFVIILGILINWISTYFAVNRFLRIKTDDLYYFH
ncbi:MAG: cell division protein FtsX [Bacteroidales bacterium]|nr:cell division protein FtsX [Bacteroidales bacterium]